MAALKVNPDNSITLPIPLLAIMLTAFLAVCGWGASIRSDVVTNKEAISSLRGQLAEHTRLADASAAQFQTDIKDTKAMVVASSAENTKQNAAIQETMTTVRIQLAARH
jgi:hypothetical protein